jgi:hypothetical protein
MIAELTRRSAQAITDLDPRAARLAEIEARLDRGWELLWCDAASAAERARWEESWLRLLRQYEEVCDAAA